MPMQHFTKTAIGQYAGHIITGQSISSGDKYAYSMFFKPISAQNNFHKIAMNINSQDSAIWYDYSRDGFFNDLQGTPLPSNKYVEKYANGVYRIVHIQTSTGSANRIDVNVDAYYNTNSQFLCGYAQVEAGSYPTSYIPSYGSAVTRSADSCYANDVSHAIGQTEGTIYAEIDSLQFKTGSYLGISDGTTTNRQIFGWESNGGDSGTLRLYGFWPTSYGTFNKGEKIKVAVAYKANDFALYVNGTQAATNTTASVAGTLSKVGFHSVTPGTQNYQGNAYELALFNERLSNSELADLTS